MSSTDRATRSAGPPARLYFERAVGALGGITLVALGILFIASPDAMAALVELELTTPLARGDIRTVYGGLEVGLGLLQLGWLRSAEGVQRAIQLHLAVWGGLAGGRALGLLLSSAPLASGVGLFATELAGLALGVVAWLRLRRAAA